MEYIKQSNLSFKIKIDEFMNLMPSTEIKIKKVLDDYLGKLKKNERIKALAQNIISEIEKQSLFKNNKAIFYLDENDNSTSKICNNFKDIFDCQFISSDLIIEDYQY